MEIDANNWVTGMTQSDVSRLYRRIRRKLGEPVMGVELRDEQLKECVEEAIEEYSSFINSWALENKMSQMLGLPSNIDFTLKFVSNNFGFERTFARAFSDIAGTSSNSTRELKLEGITLTAGTQHYYIPEGREINEVLWYTPSFINLFGLDPFSNANIAFTEFGASFAGNSLYSVMPIYDTLLTAQAATVRNKVRGSEYSYRIVGGPNGTKRLSLFPIPRIPASSYASPGFNTPGVVFYNYYDTIGVGGNDSFNNYDANPNFTGTTDAFGNVSQGNGLVSGPSDAKLYNLTYSELNDPAKRWIKRYAQANAKELLGIGVRGKFSGVIPIPGGEVTLNAESLITNGKADMDALREELGATLDKLNYKAILENNATIQESINKTFLYTPLGIWKG